MSDRPAPVVRNAAKALIVRDGAILLQVCRIGGRVVHLLPGGGQHGGEALDTTVRREVLEETGLPVRVERLLWVREFINRNHLPSGSPDGHGLAVIFQCTPLTDAAPAAGTEPDSTQIDVRWVPLAALPTLTMWPEVVQRRLIAWHTTGAPLVEAVYLGDAP
jgi:8-oxo-dGTP diphosphatase